MNWPQSVQLFAESQKSTAHESSSPHADTMSIEVLCNQYPLYENTSSEGVESDGYDDTQGASVSPIASQEIGYSQIIDF